jgi:hypothetical protein
VVRAGGPEDGRVEGDVDHVVDVAAGLVDQPEVWSPSGWVATVDWLRVLVLTRWWQPAGRVPGHTFVTPRWRVT